MKNRVYHVESGKAGTVIRDNGVPLVLWDDGTRTAEQWSSLTIDDGRHHTWTISGGPNDGLQLWFKPADKQTDAAIGADRFTVRHHDRTLEFRQHESGTNDDAWLARCQELLDEFDPLNDD